MARNIIISKLISAILVLGIFIVSQNIEAASQTVSATTESRETAESDTSKDAGGDQVAVQLSQEEIDAIAEALPEGEARQIFNSRVSTGTQKDKSSSDEVFKQGEVLIPIFFESEKAFSHAQKQISSFFTDSTFRSREWSAALDNLNMGKGPGHLMLTFFMAAVLIVCGLAVEWLGRRATGNLRRQMLDNVSLGHLQFAGRVVSHFLLDLLGLGAFMLTAFVLFAIFYDEGDPGFAVVSAIIILSYYLRFAILAANLVLSPAKPALRLFPLQDEDAKFLYRWFIGIAATMMVGGTISYMLLGAGISQESYLLIYSLAGFSVSILLVVMIWRGRHRVARAIWRGDSSGGVAKPFLRVRIAKNWHWMATLFVLGIGIFWVIRGMAGEGGALVPIITSILVIPIFIGVSYWAERLLDTASGVSPSSKAPQATDVPETVSDPMASSSEETDAQESDKRIYLQQHLTLLKGVLRILMAALTFFLILRLWGIDLPVGRIFTSTALNILGLALLGIVVWQYIKTRIDRKIREEMPDDDEEMEEGGRGGSRIGTLLVLLRKFILSVLFVMVSLIILSSVGVNIGPLIAGAGVIGLAIGFGSQTLVKDILSGVFFLIDDAFRVGDYIETGGIKGMVQHISLRSVKLRHPRGMVFTIPFGDMGAVQNFSRDYIITKLDVRVRYDADIEKIRKIIKKIGKEFEQHEEIGPVLLSPIKSQGVREMDDSAMILRVKFKTPPGEQFVVRREVYRRIQERFREEGIEFAHRNVTVYLPPEVTGVSSAEGPGMGGQPDKTLLEASAAAAIAATEAEEAEKKPKK